MPIPLHADPEVVATPYEPDVLVVGAGPVGMFAAISLAEHGLHVQIVDEQRRPAARSYALALHSQSLRLLDEAGLARELLAAGYGVGSLALYSGGRRRARLRLSEPAEPGEPAGELPALLVLPQQILERALESRLRELEVPVLWHYRVAEVRPGAERPLVRVEVLGRDSNGSASIEERVLVRPAFVLGADGHRSLVRAALGASFEEVGDAELFAVFEFQGETGAEREVAVVLEQAGEGVLWPLGGGRWRWSFHIADWEGLVEPRFKSRLYAEIGEDPLPYLAQERLRALVAERASWFHASLGEVVWSMAVRFEKRLASRFGRGAVWLAGDAAHLASPMGVQSMNVGLKEAHELAQRIARVQRDGAPHDLLEDYGREQQEEWLRLLGVEGCPEPEPRAEDWVRRQAGRLLPALPASGRDLARLLGELGLRWEPRALAVAPRH